MLVYWCSCDVFWNKLFCHNLQSFYYICCFWAICFCSIVSFTIFLVFPEVSLYTSLHGLPRDVFLQYCFHEFFSFLITAWSFFFSSMYWFFQFSPSSSLFSVCWYLLSAIVLFHIILRASIHQGTDFPFAVVFGEFRCLNIFFHVDCVVSSNFSINSLYIFDLLSLCSVFCLFL